MNVKRYFGKTAREALRQLKAELGADAIVLSNRAVDDGVEILALPAEAVGSVASAAAPAPHTSEARRNEAPRRAAAPARATASRPPVQHEFPPMDDDSGDDYRISLSAQRQAQHAAQQRTQAYDSTTRSPRVASARAAARPAQPARSLADHPVVRAFEPPRVETADYLMNQAPYPEGIEISAPRRRGPEPAGVAATAMDEDFAAEPRVSARPAVEPENVAERVAERIAERLESERQAAQRRSQEDEARIKALQEANAKLMEELGSIRGMIERQLAGFAWNETRKNSPARAEILGELLEAGFSAELARKLADRVHDGAGMEEARVQVRQMLARDMHAMSADRDIIDQGGIFALVGPTGVGKTTTTAKIAARFVVRHGAEHLAMITTDGYRIGAQEQLRIYGRILGVPVFPVRDAAELRHTLSELRHKKMVLIDTVGMSQRDRMVAQQAAMLSGAGSVRRLLLLNSTCRGDTLDDVIKAYRGPDLAGCILTKVDETASLAPAIGAAIDHDLDICYVTNGQRVPEDLHLPNRAYLLHRALRSSAEHSPWRLQGDEAALMMAAGMER